MSSVQVLKVFDKNQLFRFFVDGRFHKKYRGWVGYEENEAGSVKGMLNAYCYILDHFDISKKLSTHYLTNLHKECMSNVQTRNSKSTPGEFRFLEAGFYFHSKTMTINSLREIFHLRKHDGTVLFHTKGYQKTADEIDFMDAYWFIKKNKKLRFRPWYPNLTQDEKDALDNKGTLEDYYRVKHSIQLQFAKKTAELVTEFNVSIEHSTNDNDKLLAISRLVRNLELLHSFPDGNARTFICALMNHLLLYYDFYPAILNNPNIDAALSDAEFALEIMTGMENTKTLLYDSNHKLYNYSIKESATEDKKRFSELSAELIEKIAAFQDDSDHTSNDHIYLTPKKLSRITGGKWINSNNDMRFKGIASGGTYTDGCLYYCLNVADWIKEKKSVQQEIDRISKKGIGAVVVDYEHFDDKIQSPVLLVDNVEKSLREAAIAARREVDCKTVLVTGSVGKTGVKIQLHHCLKKQVQTHAVLNSANTKIPVLRSLASLRALDRVEINEVSVGGRESIGVDRSQIVRPDICVFTDLGPIHMDIHLTPENLVKSKSSVVEGLKDDGLCIINSNAEYFQLLKESIVNRRDVEILTFGLSDKDTAKLIRAKFDRDRYGWHVSADIDGRVLQYFLPLFQRHAPLISVGVLLIVSRFGYDVERASLDYHGIKSFGTMGRLFRLTINGSKILLYDQSQRGAIQGMRSAFEDLKNFQVDGKIVALLGGVSVRDDSEWTKKYHRELAQLTNLSNIEKLYTTGNYMHYMHEELRDDSILVTHSDDIDELLKGLLSDLQDGDLLFIRGSVHLRLNKLVNKILSMNKYEILI